MNYMEMAHEAEEYATQNAVYIHKNCEVADFEYHELLYRKFADLVATAARADERDFIATKWENLYGYDKQGVAEFIRKRANTQGEQHEQTN